MKNKFIPLSVPNLKGNENKYVTKAVSDEWVSTGGSYINEFENNIAKYVGVKKAVACQSGTAGIHLALKALGVGIGDEVIVPTLTFIAAVNPIKYLGADPIFMDCDDSLNMDLDKLKVFLDTQCKLTEEGLVNINTNKIIKALIIVHIFGNLIDMEKVMNIANKYGLKVMEDATESLGSYYLSGKYEGYFAGTIGDIGVYSFNGNKIITTGGGGMVVSREHSYLEHIKYLSTQAKDDELYYIHKDIGYNYRMTNLQAALGVAQLEQLESFIDIKIKNYNLYKEKVLYIDGLTLMKFNKNTRSNHWFYSILIDENKYGLSRDQLLLELQKNNIQTRPIWGLIHEQKPYLNNENYKIEKAKYYIDNILNIPCSTNLSEEDVIYVCDILKQIKK